jgi:hypothetical protein
MFRCDGITLSIVMPALVAGIHVFLAAAQRSKAWMAGTSPAMTAERWFNLTGIPSKTARAPLVDSWTASLQ